MQQLSDWILAKIQQNIAPETIARQFSQTDLDEATWQHLIQRAKELGGSVEGKAFLLTLFHIAKTDDEWMTLRILGIIVQTPTFERSERQNALSSIEKRLARLEKMSLDSPAQTQLREFSAYALILKGSLLSEEQELNAAMEAYQQAHRIYTDLGNKSFVQWIENQIQKLSARRNGTTSPASQAQGEQPTAPLAPANTKIAPKLSRQVARPPFLPGGQPVQPIIRRSPPRSASAFTLQPIAEQKEIEHARQQLQQLQQAIAEHQQTLSKLEKQDQLEKSLNELRQQLSAAQEALQSARDEIAAKNRQIAALQKRLEDSIQQESFNPKQEQRESVNLRRELAGRDRKIEELQEIITKREKRIIEMNRELHETHEEAGQIRRELQAAQDQIEQLENALAEAQKPTPKRTPRSR
jgi:DNA repair exonuclease SbcCD ATPase subunit